MTCFVSWGAGGPFCKKRVILTSFPDVILENGMKMKSKISRKLAENEPKMATVSDPIGCLGQQ